MQTYNQTMKFDLAHGLERLTDTCSLPSSLVGYLTMLLVSRLHSTRAVLNMLQMFIILVLMNLLPQYQLCPHKFIT
jgi:hypothetical protein